MTNFQKITIEDEKRAIAEGVIKDTMSLEPEPPRQFEDEPGYNTMPINQTNQVINVKDGGEDKVRWRGRGSSLPAADNQDGDFFVRTTSLVGGPPDVRYDFYVFVGGVGWVQDGQEI